MGILTQGRATASSDANYGSWDAEKQQHVHEIDNELLPDSEASSIRAAGEPGKRRDSCGARHQTPAACGRIVGTLLQDCNRRPLDRRRLWVYHAGLLLRLVVLLLAFVFWAAIHIFSPKRLVLGQKDGASWHKYVRAPASSIVKPQAIVAEHTRGDITNHEALITGNGVTTLSRAANSTEKATLVVDFGQNIVGLLSIEFAGSVNGSGRFPGLRLAFSESLEFLGDRSDFTRSDNAGQNAGDSPVIVPSGTDQIAVKNEPYVWLDQWGCEFGDQVCADGLHGFRYLKIGLDALPEDAPYTSSSGQVRIGSVNLQWSGFLGTPETYTGWFECSDADLTQWWYDGAYTVEMCTDVFRDNDTEARGAFSESLAGHWVLHDGAKRDRDPYMGDLAVGALTSYLTHDKHDAARNVMEDLALHQRDDGWIPPASIRHYELPLFDYPLWWVSCSWDHVMYTGNLSYLESYYPALAKVLDTYYPNHTDSTTSLLVRPPGYGDYAFVDREGSAAYYSALYVLALKRAASLASLLSRSRPGCDDDAARWRARAASVSRGFLAALWDPAAPAFLDRNCTGAGGPACAAHAHAQDGNSLAVLAKIADPTRARAALDYLHAANARPWGNAFYDRAGEALGPGYSDRVYPFISYFEIAARFEVVPGGSSSSRVSSSASALDQIRRTWGWMGAHDPGSTTWEGIGAGGSKYEGAFTSLAHPWSSGVTPLLTTYVLGVAPVAPGFRVWVVRPRTGDLAWARGAVPTAYGAALEVGWERGAGDGGRISVSVSAPAGTRGTVVLPVAGGDGGDGEGDGGRVWADGNLETSGEVVDGNVVFRVEGGKRIVIGYPRAQ